MRPNHNRNLAAIVARLLNHYWVPDLPSEVWQAQFEDWLDDLGGFDADVVADACTEWRRRPGNRRPTPGDIRALCVQAQREKHEHQLAISHQFVQWPDWLADIYGPAPEGPRKRAEAMRAQTRG